MKRRTILLAALLSVTLLSGLAWLIFRNQEPVYQEKRLSEWLSQREYVYDLGQPGTLNAGAQQAVHELGTNAIPTLLRMLRAHDSNLKLKLIGLAQRQHFIKIPFVRAGVWNDSAVQAFAVLGTTASNAVPALILMYEEGKPEKSRVSAAYALGYIGPAAGEAVPVLLRTAGDTNASRALRGSAAWALGKLHIQPELVVPVLIKCLKDSNKAVRYDALIGLSFLQNDAKAKAVVPALVDLLQDPDTAVRGTAEVLLKIIDPEAAAKAGIK